MLSVIDDVNQVENDTNESQKDHPPTESVLDIVRRNPISEETHMESESTNEYFIYEFYPIFQLRVKWFVHQLVNDDEPIEILKQN